MASSDEEGEIVPEFVTNYQIVDSDNAPIPFSNLPLHWSDHENGDSLVVYLRGTTDGSLLQQIYKEVIAWKLELSSVVPEVYMLSKGKTWIKLQKPRKSYQHVIESVSVVIQCLHFAKRNVEATRDEILSHLMKTLSSYDMDEPLEKYLSAHVPLIQNAVAEDKDLANSKYLETFLMEIENPERRQTLHEENRTTNESKFIVLDDEVEYGDDIEDEVEGLFDSVCAMCDNGGDVLPCEGRCTRSFHPTIEAGVDTNCESLGFADAAQYEAIATFICNNCKHQKHQCFACGMLGSSDKCSAVEVFPCVSATCGHFYHPECVAQLLYPSDETLAKQLQSQIAAGEPFVCPIHKCHLCKHGENKEVHDLQFAVCRRCPKAYHRKCLPREIAYEGSADGTVEPRAWDNLLPKRILIYCMNHEIHPSLATPIRNHLLFPCIVWKKNQEGRKIEKRMSEKRSKAFGNLKENDPKKMLKAVERQYNTVTYGDTASEKGKSSTMCEKRSSFKNNISIARNSEQPSTMVQSKSACRDMQRERSFTSKPVKKITEFTPPSLDNDTKTRILKLMKDSTSSFNFEEFIKEKKRRCTHEIYSPRIGLDKTITTGKVEASVKAVRAALKKLEDGCSVEDAKVVCEPEVLNQLIRWKKKLRVFLAPFLHGARYTSFGRHFTKVDKLKEIVNRLHWYVDDDDMIVDFCCGSNDFSCFMKEKLDSMGKRCSFKNYDLITTKKPFNFEKRDWFSVPVEALPDGSRLVMGLNPPFGVQASLANKFINHALKFKPKLLILIVPKETERLDQKRSPYDLIWEEEWMLSGKSFYLPGSVDTQDQPLDDWNLIPPSLYLWSRPDWTAKHKALAEKHSHVTPKQNKIQGVADRVVSNYPMEKNHDYHDDFSNIMSKHHDNSTTDGGQPGGSNPSTTDGEGTNMTSDIGMHIQDTIVDMADTNLSSPVNSSTNFRSTPTRLDTLCIQPRHDNSTIFYNVTEEPDGGQPGGSNPSTTDGEGTNMTSDIGMHIQETIVDMADTNLSSPVNSSTNSRSTPRRLDILCIQPRHDNRTIFDNVTEEPDGGQPGGSNPSTSDGEGTNMTSDIEMRIHKTIVDMDLSSPVISSTNSRSTTPTRLDTPCIQPRHSGHYPGFGPPEHANTSIPYGSSIGFGYTQSGHYPGFGPPQHADTSIPYGSGIGFGYTLSGQMLFEAGINMPPGTTSRYGQDDFAMASMQPPYADYSHTTHLTNDLIRPQGPACIYGQQDFTWPPTQGPTFVYGQPDFTSETNIWPPPQGPTFVYGQPDFTRETNIWPPGTTPPDHRYGQNSFFSYQNQTTVVWILLLALHLLDLNRLNLSLDF